MELFNYLVGHEADPVNWWQMSNRAAIIFFYALALYRLIPRKAFNGSAAHDIVLTVIMGSNLSRALTGNAPIVATMVATAVMAVLYVLVSFLARKWDWLSRLIKGRPTLLIRDGTLDERAMRRAQFGPRDLTENLRLSGVRGIEEVAEAFLERNGALSVIKKS